MRALVLIAAMAIAAASSPAAAMPQPPATSDKLEQLATIVEGMHGNSTIVDQRIADMLRPLAASDGNVIPDKAPPYTAFLFVASKARPQGWLMGGGELVEGGTYMVVSKYDADGKFTDPNHQRSGHSIIGGQVGAALALNAALLRAWAQILRTEGR
jgi:hypothetical protein